MGSSALAVLAYYGYALLGQFIISILEGYVFMAFLGLMVAYGWSKGNVYQALLTSKRYVDFCCSFLRFKFGPRMTDGKAVLRVIFWMVLQLLIVKPLMSLVKFLVADDSEKVPRLAKGFLSLVSVVSITIASLGLFRAYHSLSRFESSDDDEVGLLAGVKPFGKFFIIKLLVLVVVLNNLILGNLIPSPMEVPPFICSDQISYCQGVYSSFIFCCESAILMFPAAMFFSGFRRFFPNKQTDGPAESLCARYFYFWDVFHEFLVPPESYRVCLTSYIEDSFAPIE